jgi:hypothetical protein
MSDKFILQYSGLHYGKTELAAIVLAEKTRKYTSIEIVVTPHKDLEELRSDNDRLKARVDKLEAVREAAEKLANRHDWHPDLGQCVCSEHIIFRDAIKAARSGE